MCIWYGCVRRSTPGHSGRYRRYPEEAGAHGRRDSYNDSETVAVLNHVREREKGDSPGAGGQRRMENGTDRQVSEVEDGRELRGAEAPTATEAAITEDVLEEGDAERPATFWEERGPSRYGLQPERGSRRREL
ncbi:hypothetical protein NDU88_001614 [Pleurodeles waltl]|uniref:Uncharacterized protein n=1 Tax=Pleurodeles waltl TaxID=8319 RepID=A0AAV7U7C9_PLEWA|nr:hypothetical protein NDU88_001614 [Pleurodeles waltl]